MDKIRNGQPGERQGATGRAWLMGAEAFKRRMPHHDGMKALWETQWKFACTKGIYPFREAKYEDFEPIFGHLIEHKINDGTSTEYTEAFFPVAESLTARGDEAAAVGNKTVASGLYLRASSVYRIARFPYITSFPKISCPVKWRAWVAQKEVYLKAATTWERPVEEVLVQHTRRQGQDRDRIPVYVRVPRKADTEDTKYPVVVLLTGLDGHRPDFTEQFEELLSRGWAAVAVEIPGTADSPADPADPESPDRLWSSLLDWMAQDGRFDLTHVVVWGLSTGGYYAVRIAHTHKDQLIGCIAQGAGCHYFFGQEWLENIDGHEYPFLLTPAMAMKHGYSSVKEYRDGAQKKFSLLESGIIERPSTRLLLVNGVLDGLMPIEDSMMLFEYGTPKEARFFSDALHMGSHRAGDTIYTWIHSVMASV